MIQRSGAVGADAAGVCSNPLLLTSAGMVPKGGASAKVFERRCRSPIALDGWNVPHGGIAGAEDAREQQWSVRTLRAEVRKVNPSPRRPRTSVRLIRAVTSLPLSDVPESAQHEPLVWLRSEFPVPDRTV